MPTTTEHAFKEKTTNFLSFYPSEPFTFRHFNVRHPVQLEFAFSEILAIRIVSRAIKEEFVLNSQLQTLHRPIKF